MLLRAFDNVPNSLCICFSACVCISFSCRRFFCDLFYILMNFLSFSSWMKVWRWHVLIYPNRFFCCCWLHILSLLLIMWMWCLMIMWHMFEWKRPNRDLTNASLRCEFHKATCTCVTCGFSYHFVNIGVTCNAKKSFYFHRFLLLDANIFLVAFSSTHTHTHKI